MIPSISPEGRSVLGDAVRYWEPRRPWYNAALALVCAWWVVWTWPHFRGAFSVFHGFQLLDLAVLANLCYSSAYMLEVAFSPAGPSWRRFRGGVFIAGTLFAILLAWYWIGDEIYPSCC